MGTFDDLTQKVKGSIQDTTGKVQKNLSPDAGGQISGTIKQVKGKVNKAAADFKLQNRGAKTRNK